MSDIRQRDLSQSEDQNLIEITTPSSENQDTVQQDQEDDKYKKHELQKQEQLKNQKRKILPIILLIFSFLFYGVFIEPICPESQFPVDDQCIEGVLVPNISLWINCIIISAILLYCVIVMWVRQNVSKYIGGFAIIQALFQIFIYHGTIEVDSISLRSYKSAHAIALGVFITFIAASHISYMAMKYVLKNSKIAVIIMIILGCYSSVRIYHSITHSCDHWDYGLAQKIDDNEVYCDVPKPSICFPDILDNVFNFGSETCEVDLDNYDHRKTAIIDVLSKYEIINKNDTQQKIKYVFQNFQYIAWPITKFFHVRHRVSENFYIQTLIKNVKHYTSLDKAFESGSEIVIDTQNYEMKINIPRNETLVEERRKIIEKIEEEEPDRKSIGKNVIVVYIDTVSRAQTFRKLKKSMNHLKKYARYKHPQYSEQKLDKKVFEFFRYHSIDRRTYDNVFKLQYDINSYQYKQNLVKLDKEKKLQSLYKELQDQGYITGHASNSLSLNSIFRGIKHEDEFLYEYFNQVPADHEFYNFDPTYVMKDNPFGIKKGSSSFYRRCMYNKDSNYFPFEYGKQFLEQYKDEKKFLFLEFSDGHEVTSEIVQYIDENLNNFLNYVENNQDLKEDTVIYFLSDHGQHMLSAFQILGMFTSETNNVYQIERMLPFFYMMVTNDLLKKYEGLQQNLEQNQQTVFTISNFRESLLTNAYGLQHKKSFKKSLYSILDKENTCMDIGMIPLPRPQRYCSCKPREGFALAYKNRKQKELEYKEKQKQKYEELKKQREAEEAQAKLEADENFN